MARVMPISKMYRRAVAEGQDGMRRLLIHVRRGRGTHWRGVRAQNSSRKEQDGYGDVLDLGMKRCI